MKTGEGKVVCVTGASSFIASSLVEALLINGYTVNATVRNLTDPAKVAHLKPLQGAKERLRLFQADLMEQGSFDAAVDGCDGVFHVASPVIFGNIKDPQAEVIEPAVNGTLNVLKSCLKVSSIKRVVLTSSLATVMVSQKAVNGNFTVDETWHSDPAFCEENKTWYFLSKTLAEETAWKFAKQHCIDLVVLNPGMVIGHSLLSSLNVGYVDFLKLIKEGKSEIFTLFGACILVDIKDVVEAHVLAFENPSANGRYCLASASMHISEIYNILREFYPTISLPNPKCDEENGAKGHVLQISKEKAECLGIKFTPIEESLKETVEVLKERNLLVIP